MSHFLYSWYINPNETTGILYKGSNRTQSTFLIWNPMSILYTGQTLLTPNLELTPIWVYSQPPLDLTLTSFELAMFLSLNMALSISLSAAHVRPCLQARCLAEDVVNFLARPWCYRTFLSYLTIASIFTLGLGS